MSEVIPKMYLVNSVKNEQRNYRKKSISKLEIFRCFNQDVDPIIRNKVILR